MNPDKILHSVAGCIIALVLGIINPWLGLVAAVAIGAAKEIVYDKMLGKGTADILDFAATAIGGLIGFICVRWL